MSARSPAGSGDGGGGGSYMHAHSGLSANIASLFAHPKERIASMGGDNKRKQEGGGGGRGSKRRYMNKPVRDA